MLMQAADGTFMEPQREAEMLHAPADMGLAVAQYSGWIRPETSQFCIHSPENQTDHGQSPQLSRTRMEISTELPYMAA
jgi:hypothetical protein